LGLVEKISKDPQWISQVYRQLFHVGRPISGRTGLKSFTSSVPAPLKNTKQLQEINFKKIVQLNYSFKEPFSRSNV
jgi:hypothetical protein